MKSKVSHVKPRCLASPARLAAAKKRSLAAAKRKWGDVPMVDLGDIAREIYRRCGPAPVELRRPRQPR